MTCLASPAVGSDGGQNIPPVQLGVGVPRGPEILALAMRLALERHPEWVALKLDFRNAFNRVNRAAMLRAVRDRLPHLLPWVLWCYRTPSHLRFGDLAPLLSAEGVQQGDPLGPLLFALTVQPLIERLAGIEGLDLVQFFLDDGALCGTVESHFGITFPCDFEFSFSATQP